MLNDLNRELIVAFQAVRDDAEALIERLGELERAYLDLDGAEREDCYYGLRQEYRELVAAGGADDIDVASRLIFLNKTCFNGLYRVNRSGEFNVPHGRYARPRILDAPAIEAASASLAGVELRSMDFKEACEGAGPGDFVYFDPPFQPLSETSSFTAYTEGGFGRDDQLRLKWWIDELSRRGVPALVSNSANEWLRGVYEGGGYVASQLDGEEPFWPDLGRAEEVNTNRLINSRGDLRQDFVELLISNHALLSASKKKS